MSKAIFAKIARAPVIKRSPDFRPGRGVVLVKSGHTNDGTKGHFYILECEILKSEPTTEPHPDTGTVEAPNAVGESVAWKQNMNGVPQQSNLAGFAQTLLSSLGVDQSQMNDDVLAEALAAVVRTKGEATEDKPDFQIARGMLFKYETRYSRVQRGERAGKINTYCDLKRVAPDPKATEFGGNSEAEVAARRADLDQREPLY